MGQSQRSITIRETPHDSLDQCSATLKRPPGLSATCPSPPIVHPLPAPAFLSLTPGPPPPPHWEPSYPPPSHKSSPEALVCAGRTLLGGRGSRDSCADTAGSPLAGQRADKSRMSRVVIILMTLPH